MVCNLRKLYGILQGCSLLLYAGGGGGGQHVSVRRRFYVLYEMYWVPRTISCGASVFLPGWMVVWVGVNIWCFAGMKARRKVRTRLRALIVMTYFHNVPSKTPMQKASKMEEK